MNEIQSIIKYLLKMYSISFNSLIYNLEVKEMKPKTCNRNKTCYISIYILYMCVSADVIFLNIYVYTYGEKKSHAL